MDNIKTGNLIYQIRKSKKMTQKELADRLHLSDKTISKWERGQGCPDIASINDLAEVLGVNVTDILSGDNIIGDNNSGNMIKTKFYVCPICGNVIASSNDMLVSCCGRKLLKQQVNKSMDSQHTLNVEILEGEFYISVKHEMEKKHYISFLAYVTSDTMYLRKLYPEQQADANFPRNKHGILYAYCTQHGLWSKVI